MERFWGVLDIQGMTNTQNRDCIAGIVIVARQNQSLIIDYGLLEFTRYSEILDQVELVQLVQSLIQTRYPYSSTKYAPLLTALDTART